MRRYLRSVHLVTMLYLLVYFIEAIVMRRYYYLGENVVPPFFLIVLLTVLSFPLLLLYFFISHRMYLPPAILSSELIFLGVVLANAIIWGFALTWLIGAYQRWRRWR
jgi:hypothetical protein